LGFWMVLNDVSDDPRYVSDDQYGLSYVQSRYSLLSLGLRLNAEELTGANASSTLNAHLRGRAFLNLEGNRYAYGFNDRTRQQLDEANLEWSNVAQGLDLWFGRQRIYESGGDSVDGLRAVYHFTPKSALALYGGLGADPRNYVGAITPTYRQSPFSLDFQAAGAYHSFRGERFWSDVALRTLFYKGELDRGTVFGQGTYNFSPTWSFSGLVEADAMGVRAFRTGSGSVVARPHTSVTNTTTVSYWRPYQYEASNVSAIPPIDDPNYLTDPIGGTVVTDSYYISARDHLQFRLFGRNYLFGAVQFTRRSFDSLNQWKYTVGYRDPNLGSSPFDLRAQLDLIDNYLGFNLGGSLLVGYEFREGLLRLETGGGYFANERTRYVDTEPTTSYRETEKEYVLQANAYYNPTRTLSCVLNYAFEVENDVVDARNVHIHEVYATTHWRF